MLGVRYKPVHPPTLSQVAVLLDQSLIFTAAFAILLIKQMYHKARRLRFVKLALSICIFVITPTVMFFAGYLIAS